MNVGRFFLCFVGAISTAIFAQELPRRLAMAESGRTVVLSIDDSLWVGWDPERFRPHGIWLGGELDIRGPAFTQIKNPFLSRFTGTRLWGLPPYIPWSLNSDRPDVLAMDRGESRFIAIEMGGTMPFLEYEIREQAGKALRVREGYRNWRTESASVSDLDNAGIVRRLELGARQGTVWWLAWAGAAVTASTDSEGNSVRIFLGNPEIEGQSLNIKGQSSNIDNNVSSLLLTHRGDDATEVQWHLEECAVDYPVVLLGERGMESVRVTNRVQGMEWRVWLKISPGPESVLEILTETAPNSDPSEWNAAESASVRSFQSGTPASRATIGKHSRQMSPRVLRPELPPMDHPLRGGTGSYGIENFPIPKELGLLVTGMDWVSARDLAICTWPGEIWILENATGAPMEVRYRRFAKGLGEAFGLKVIDGEIYVVQKMELTRVLDTDADGVSDRFECVQDGWGFSGNYHAFAFGPAADAVGNLYVAICGHRGWWELPYTGWCVQIPSKGQSQGELLPWAGGLRSPNGIGTYGPDHDLFVTDNQGQWIGSCRLNHLQHGRYYGHPAAWPAPEAYYERPPDPAPPAVWFPRSVSMSASGFVTIPDEGFGPFGGQLLVGEFQLGTVLRVSLEKINGEWQGTVWPWLSGFSGAVNRLAFGPDGHLYVGGAKNASWPTPATQDGALERVRFTGEIPFEIQNVRLLSDGFELQFTEALSDELDPEPDDFLIGQFRYRHTSAYGSPEIDHEGQENRMTSLAVQAVILAGDRRSVRLRVNGLRAGYVTRIRVGELLSVSGKNLEHDTCYYTLNQFPAENP
jgi:glucose/arabinose dehydrogenase